MSLGGGAGATAMGDEMTMLRGDRERRLGGAGGEQAGPVWGVRYD